MKDRCKECKHLAMCVVVDPHAVGRELWHKMRRERHRGETTEDMTDRIADVACGAREQWRNHGRWFMDPWGRDYYVDESDKVIWRAVKQ